MASHGVDDLGDVLPVDLVVDRTQRVEIEQTIPVRRDVIDRQMLAARVCHRLSIPTS
jgi:hypothetical protein